MRNGFAIPPHAVSGPAGNEHYPYPPIPRPRRPAARRWRDIALLGGLFALVIAGLAGLAAATGWAETRAHLTRLSAGRVALLLGSRLVNYLFRGARWPLFARRLGLPTGLMQDVRHVIGGLPCP